MPPPDTPCVHTRALDTLWFQVGGTICNLRCHHCFISCSPENDKFRFLSLDTCLRRLEESKPLGVKEYYFTGGEPFANPAMCDILEHTLAYGPATVLTNATLFRPTTLDRLEAMAAASMYSLEIRVSLDGYTAEMNDPIRGEGTFDQAMEGVARLVRRGFLPILTITRTWSGDDDDVLAGFVRLLGTVGYHRPRLKILPTLKLGAEVDRTGGYTDDERLTHAMMAEFDESQLVCSAARLVTDQGVWVSPILLDDPDARMGDRLADTIRDYPLRHAACYTCWQYGAICSNVSSAATAVTDA
ncbi:MAG: radical SAM protein [Phycisphaerae bacterium]